MEKSQLIDFVSKIMENAGFKVYRNSKPFHNVVDLYCIFSNLVCDFTVAVACRNHDNDFEIGVDALKELEMVGKSLDVSKILLVSSSRFSSQAKSYSSRRNIELLDREALTKLSKTLLENEGLSIKSNNEIDENSLSQGSESFESYHHGNDMGIANTNTKLSKDFNISKRTSKLSKNHHGDIAIGRNNSDEVEVYSYGNGLNDSRDSYGLGRNGLSKSHNYAYGDYHSRDEFFRKYSYRYVDKGKAKKKLSKNSPDHKIGGNPKKLRPKSRAVNDRHSFKNQKQVKSNQQQYQRINQKRTGIIKPKRSALNRRKHVEPSSDTNLLDVVKVLLNNVPILIIFVVAISCLISYLIAILLNVSGGVLGIVKMFSSLVLSYTIAFSLTKSGSALLKGTVVFFISFILLILITLFL